MSNKAKESKPKQSTDVLLQEMWRIKDILSVAYGRDVDRVFAKARERQKSSSHRIVNLQTERGNR